MAFLSRRQLLGRAAEHAHARPAFNVNNMEQVLAVMGCWRPGLRTALPWSPIQKKWPNSCA